MGAVAILCFEGVEEYGFGWAGFLRNDDDNILFNSTEEAERFMLAHTLSRNTHKIIDLVALYFNVKPSYSGESTVQGVFDRCMRNTDYTQGTALEKVLYNTKLSE